MRPYDPRYPRSLTKPQAVRVGIGPNHTGRRCRSCGTVTYVAFPSGPCGKCGAR